MIRAAQAGLTVWLAAACYTPKPVDFGGDGDGDTDATSSDTDPGGGEGDALAVPPGTLAFDASPTGCPAGWSEWLDAQGRAIVAVRDAADAGVTTGDALSTLEPHPHTHTLSADITIDGAGLGVLSGCCNDTPGHSGAHTATGALDEGGAGLPTIGMRVCRRDGDVDPPSSGSPFALGAAAFFDRAACPAGWSALDEAAGRFVVATTGAAPALQTVGVSLANGEDRIHVHHATLAVTLPARSLAAAGGSNSDPGQAGDYVVDADTDPATSGLPYVQALLCRAEAPLPPPDPRDEVVPAGLVTWSTESTCADGWVEPTRLAGRFVVGLPTGVGAGAVHGEALEAGEDREHGHTGALTLRVPFASVAILSGCCLDGIAPHGLFDVAVEVEPAPVGLPTIALRACEKR